MINKDKLLDNAHKLLAKGQLPKAIGEYQKLVEAFPRDFYNRLKLAELLTRERRLEEARPHYETVARHFAETGFHLKAVAIYKQIQQHEPERSEIYLRIAELYEQLGLVGNALNEYRGLVACYQRQRLTHEALGILRKMTALDPAHLANRCQLIEALLACDETIEAGSQFLDLIRVLDDRGEYAGVVKCFEKFPTLTPDDLDHRLPYAKALLLSSQAERALPLLRGCYQQAPEHPALLSLLSDCYLALGYPDEAGETCRQLLDLQPTNPGLRERYLRLCIDAGRFREALTGLEAWRCDFTGSGRVAVFQELVGLLDAAWPGNPHLQTLLASEPVDAPDGTEETAAELPVQTMASGASAPDAVAEPSAGFELEPGIPLADFRPDTPATATGQAVAADPSAGPGLELEFDLDDLQASEPAPPLDEATLTSPEPALLSMELPEFTDLDFAMESSGPEPVDAAAGSSPVTAGAEHDKLDAVLYAMQVGDVAAGPDTPAAAGALDVESQSHFDLGIGYKEMAMFASAIAEFDKALTGRFRIADCLTLMAQCRLAMGQVATAEANFQEALRQPELKEAGRIALRYELGLLYENSGRLLEALENFQEVADRDRLFREATGKVTALRQALGLDEQGDKSAPGPGPGGHKRISYV